MPGILDEGPAASIQLPSAWRLIARDAFNGTILWKRDIELTREIIVCDGSVFLVADTSARRGRRSSAGR